MQNVLKNVNNNGENRLKILFRILDFQLFCMCVCVYEFSMQKSMRTTGHVLAICSPAHLILFSFELL